MNPSRFHTVCVHLGTIHGEVAVIPLLTLMKYFSLTIKSDASCGQEESFTLKRKHRINGRNKLIALLLSPLLSV